MSAGPSRCSRGVCTMVRSGSSKEKIVEEVKPIDRLGRLTDAELTTQG